MKRFMGVGQLLTIALLFASNAIYPTAMMPRALQIVAHLNPLTCQVDALRLFWCLDSMLHQHLLGLGIDLPVLTAILGGVVAVSARLYPQIVR